MSMFFRELAGKAAVNGEITSEDILALRREDWADGIISPAEAESIFTINDCIAHPSEDWCDFFIEAISEYVVNTVAPKGYVDEPQAEWLVARLERDGKLTAMSELELLAKVINKALNVPAKLKLYAMAQIERAVLTGQGPTRGDGSLDTGCITATEVSLLRRFIFAASSDGAATVSQSEAEMLFRLKDATVNSTGNAPEWQPLFVRGVANYLMAFTSYAPLSRDRALELEKFIDQPTPRIGGFLLRMINSGLGAGLKEVLNREQEADYAAELAAAEIVTKSEQAWLDAQIYANGRVDDFDQALLDFIAD